MREKRSIRLYLEEIVESMDKIERYMEGQSFDHFIQDEKLIDAVERNLEKIGEAASCLPDDLRNKYPEVPWKSMIGLRNIVIHHYFGVDREIIYQISIRNIPETKPKIEGIRNNI
jgi:uncharacterized protein with HEPN domain